MSGTRRRRGASTVLAGLIAGSGMLASQGGASASEPPLVIGRCDSTVQGERGTQVSLRPAAVEDLVVEALRPLDPLRAITPAFRETFSAGSPILIGSVLGSRSVIVGTVIAEAVIDRLHTVDALDPVVDPLEESVFAAVDAACAVITQPAPGEDGAAPPPTSPTPDEPAPPGTGSGEGGSGAGRRGEAPEGFAPGGAPGAAPDTALTGGDLLLDSGLVGGGVPPEGVAFDFSGVTDAPGFGLLGPDGRGGTAVGARSPGTAVALPASAAAGEQDRTGRVLLLAVLLLACVGAQLTRRWMAHPPGRLRIVVEPRD